MLLESRLTPGPARPRLHDGVLRALREAGFSVELAYSAFLTLDSYIYGFTFQELSWPFEPEERPELIKSMRPDFSQPSTPSSLKRWTY